MEESLLPQQLELAEDDAPIRTSKPRAPTFDVTRLVGPQGLPKLRKRVLAHKRKGHQRKDLAKFIDVYRLWMHQLWPKSNQRDMMELVAKAGNTADLKAWRREVMNEEKYGDVGDVEVQEDDGFEAQARAQAEVEVEAQARPVLDDSDDDIVLPGARSTPAPAAAPAPAPNDIPSPSDMPSPSPAEPTKDAPSPGDMPSEDEQWQIYADLGF